MKLYFDKITEKPSEHRHLEQMDSKTLLDAINSEDQKVAFAVKEKIHEISILVDAIADKMLAGGRLFYIGAGTSGRLGVVDASECPPTYGVPHGLVIGLIAGGDPAIRKAVEFAEDDPERGWKDLQSHNVSSIDCVIGIAASGTTPYVIGALEKCMEHKILTACITCNPGSPITEHAEHPIVVIVGPEIVTGSTRMKSGTAQKLVLNMISTAVMIKMGRVEDNKMVDMQMANNKLVARGIKMVIEATGCDNETASKLLKQTNSVRAAIKLYKERHA